MIRYQVTFEPLASDNLSELWDFIAHGPAKAPAVADRFIRAIIDFCTDRLSLAPFSGVARDDARSGLRTTHDRGSTVIAFVPDRSASRLSVIGIFYGGRDLTSALSDS